MSVVFSQEADGKLVGWEWIQMRSASGARGGVAASVGKGGIPACSFAVLIPGSLGQISLCYWVVENPTEWMNPCRKVGLICVTSEPFEDRILGS